jgi:hypothetical protein
MYYIYPIITSNSFGEGKRGNVGFSLTLSIYDIPFIYPFYYNHLFTHFTTTIYLLILLQPFIYPFNYNNFACLFSMYRLTIYPFFILQLYFLLHLILILFNN